MVGSFAFQNEENCKAILNLANLKVRNDIPYGIFLREINTDAEKAFVVFNWTKDQTISFKFTDQNTLDWQQGLIEFKDDYIKFAPRASAILRTKESLKNDK
jgi:hypothetical protein